MGLFGFGKKEKENKNEVVTGACACGGKCAISDIEKAKLIVLGACCQRSADSFENVKKAVAELGIQEEVLNIGNDEQIAKYGVMSTPAFVIDSKVVSMGRLITVDMAKKCLTDAGYGVKGCGCGCGCK